MQHASSGSEHDSSARLGLIWAAEGGLLDELPCPSCGSLTVSVWFTEPAKGEYRTWFTCTECDFEMRVQNTCRPKQFCCSRMDPELQKRDKELFARKRIDL